MQFLGLINLSPLEITIKKNFTLGSFMLLIISFSEALFLMESPGHVLLLFSNTRGEKLAREYSLRSKACQRFDDEIFWRQRAESLKKQNALSLQESCKLVFATSFMLTLLVIFAASNEISKNNIKSAVLVKVFSIKLLFYILLGLLFTIIINMTRFIVCIFAS